MQSTRRALHLASLRRCEGSVVFLGSRHFTRACFAVSLLRCCRLRSVDWITAHHAAHLAVGCCRCLLACRHALAAAVQYRAELSRGMRCSLSALAPLHSRQPDRARSFLGPVQRLLSESHSSTLPFSPSRFTRSLCWVGAGPLRVDAENAAQLMRAVEVSCRSRRARTVLPVARLSAQSVSLHLRARPIAASTPLHWISVECARLCVALDSNRLCQSVITLRSLAHSAGA